VCNIIVDLIEICSENVNCNMLAKDRNFVNIF
jgi:hypothetical protein